MKNITSRFSARCRDCKSPIAAGESIWWERGFGSVCDACFTKPAPVDLLTPEERATVNDFSRRYGPVGRFNRAQAERNVLAARASRTTPDHGIEEWEMGPDGDDLINQGPDALAAELSVLCEWYSDSFDGTPDEIFHRSEADGRRYERIKRLIETIDGELAGRRRLVAQNAQENAGL